MTLDSIEPIHLDTATGRIADMLRASILDGTFPPGTQVSETELAQQLKISRGPVREAMQRLVQEGLLWSKPHYGTYVTELGDDDIKDLYLARRAVEATAGMRVLGRADDTTFAALDAAVAGLTVAVDGGQWPDIVGADLNFHETLVAGAHNKRLTRMFRTLIAETRLCLAALVEGNPQWLAQAVAEHTNLVTALRRNDRAAFMALIDKHFALDAQLSYRGLLLHADGAAQERHQSPA